MRTQRGIDLLSVPRSNQKQQISKAMRQRINRLRQIVETVNNQLAEQFHVERNHAQSFWGLCTRLHTKLAAHTLCLYLNRVLGNAEFLHIKHLAFPNEHIALLRRIRSKLNRYPLSPLPRRGCA